MAEYVLVAGAWLGAWAWDEVAPTLRGEGHGVHAVTLAGQAERPDEPAGVQTHVDDVLAAAEGLEDVVLVGHSYSGIPVGQAAVRLGDRLTRVVLVDANVPVEGHSFLTGWADEEEFAADLAEHDGYWRPLPAEAFEDQGLTSDQIATIQFRAVPQPGATCIEPAHLERPLGDVTGTYVRCLLDGGDVLTPATQELLTHPTWRLVKLDTGHWPMFSAPAGLAELLLRT